MNPSWRTDNPGYLMYAATGLCIQNKLSFVHRAGFDAMTDAQLSLFHSIDMHGTRLTDIAARAALTKQSMVELVDKAQKLGLVSRKSDPTDKRAKFVTLTATGTMLIRTLKAAIEATEQRMASVCGTPFICELKRELGVYVGQVQPADYAEPIARTDLAARGTSTGRLLAISSRRFAAAALAVAHQHGIKQVGEVDLALFRNLDLQGSRLTDLAMSARMTKQSMRELVDRAEAQRFVRRDAETGDARAKIIHFTDDGLTFLDQMRMGLEEAEQNLAAVTANGFVGRLKAGLYNYLQKS